jgi:hypothetical protein
MLVGHQPAYLPWPGYFSRLLDVDRLLLLDHVQFSSGSWQQRNYVAGRDGQPRLLTVPVRRPHHQPIADVRIDGDEWRQRHWRILREAYRGAPFWPSWEPRLAAIYERPWQRLAALNEALLRLLLDGFGLHIEITRSSHLHPAGRKTDMLIDLCRITDTQALRVGTGATGYLDAGRLTAAGIGVEIADYTHPPYDQGHGGFTSGLSALDLLLRLGPAGRTVLTTGAATRPWEPAATTGCAR